MRRKVVVALTLCGACFNPSSATSSDPETVDDSGTTPALDVGAQGSTESSASGGEATSNESNSSESEASATTSTTTVVDSSESNTGGTLPTDPCEPADPGGTMVCGDALLVAGEICYPSMGSSTPLSNAEPLWALGLGDLDGNGTTDVVALTDTPSIVPGLNDGTPSFSAGTVRLIATGGMSSRGVVKLADLDGDRFDDVVMTLESLRQFVIVGSEGNGTLATSYDTFDIPDDPSAGQYELALGDLDGDSIPDIVLSGGSAIHIAVSDGALGIETLTSITTPDLAGARAVAVADVEPDGDLDIVVSYAEVVGVHHNGGRADFSAPHTVLVDIGGVAGTALLDVADLTADGAPDIAVGISGRVLTLAGNGDGTFAADGDPLDVRGLVDMALADVNADCLTDLLIAANPNQVLDLHIYANRGNGEWAEPTLFGFSGGSTAFEVTDLDGDSIPDVVGCDILGELDLSLSEP